MFMLTHNQIREKKQKRELKQTEKRKRFRNKHISNKTRYLFHFNPHSALKTKKKRTHTERAG